MSDEEVLELATRAAAQWRKLYDPATSVLMPSDVVRKLPEYASMSLDDRERVFGMARHLAFRKDAP